MPTTTVTAYKIPRDLTARYQSYQFTFQVFGTNTEHAVGIASDGLYHYYISDVRDAGTTGAIILKIDPKTGDEIDRDIWTTGAVDKTAYDLCLRRAHVREQTRGRHGLVGYLLWNNGGTMTISKMTFLDGFNIELENFSTTVNADARGICLRGNYIHVTHNNAGFSIYHDVYDINTADRILQNVIPLGMGGPAQKSGVVFDGYYLIHHLDPLKAFGFTARRYRVNISDPAYPTYGFYEEIRSVDFGTAEDVERHSITWDRYFIWDFKSEIA